MSLQSIRSTFSVTNIPANICLIVLIFVSSSSQLLAQDKSRPEIGISLGGVTENMVEQGEPMRVALQLRLDDSYGLGGAVVLAPAAGTWVDAIVVELVDAQGSATGLKAQAYGQPDAPVAILDARRSAGGLWRFTSESTRTLAPGIYAIQARLAISAAAGPNSWIGEVISEDIPLEVVALSDLPERRSQRALALAHDAILDNRLEEAATILDALLVDQRSNVAAWTVRAVASERAGNILGALQCVSEGQRHYAALQMDEPNTELHGIMDRLLAALTASNTPAEVVAPLDHWSWPPKELLSAPISIEPPPEIAGPVQAMPASEPSSVPTSPVEGATVIPVTDTVEADYLTDPRGQWASAASASSEYGTNRYNALQATGAPNVATYSDNPNAWCHSGASRPDEWLEVGFPQPVHATELRVRQSYTPGTLAKVEIFAADGRSQVLWEGNDPNVYPAKQITWFVLRFPSTAFPVHRVKLTLDMSAVSGWKQIDAVQLVGDTR